jgi:hypothetical protein
MSKDKGVDFANRLYLIYHIRVLMYIDLFTPTFYIGSPTGNIFLLIFLLQ